MALSVAIKESAGELTEKRVATHNQSISCERLQCPKSINGMSDW